MFSIRTNLGLAATGLNLEDAAKYARELLRTRSAKRVEIVRAHEDNANVVYVASLDDRQCDGECGMPLASGQPCPMCDLDDDGELNRQAFARLKPNHPVRRSHPRADEYSGAAAPKSRRARPAARATEEPEESDESDA